MDLKFDANASSVLLRVLRFVPRKEQPEFLRAMLAHTTAYLCMLEGDEAAVEALYRLGDAVIKPEVRALSAHIRENNRG